jgi:hypothetical protein
MITLSSGRNKTMEGVPVWIAFAVAATAPILGILGFWMNLSSRLTKAELTADEADKAAKDASDKASVLSASFGLYREHIASNYIHRDVMREVEDRLMQAIDRLADRLDRVLERSDRGH